MKAKIKTLKPKNRAKAHCSICNKAKSLCWELKGKKICWDCVCALRMGK